MVTRDELKKAARLTEGELGQVSGGTTKFLFHQEHLLIQFSFMNVENLSVYYRIFITIVFYGGVTMHQLQVNPDGSERLEYTMKGLPVCISTDRLRIFQDYAAACHWHDDFELLAALDGEMDYFVNSKKIHLKKGDGLRFSRFQLLCRSVQKNMAYHAQGVPKKLSSENRSGIIRLLWFLPENCIAKRKYALSLYLIR